MNATRKCSIDGCERTYRARGWCATHWYRWRVHGDPNKVLRDVISDPEEAFRARTQQDGECLVWTGLRTDTGYGLITVSKKKQRAHRYAWEQVNGEIPRGKVIDHICHNRACVNVDHLRVATVSQNAANRAGAISGATTGVRNVTVFRDKYQVLLCKDGKNHFYGHFSTLEEAARVAKFAREELFGEFAGKG